MRYVYMSDIFASSVLTQSVSLPIVYSDGRGGGGGVVVVLSKDKVEELYYEEESSTLFSLQEKGSHVTTMHTTLRAFRNDMELWKSQPSGNIIFSTYNPRNNSRSSVTLYIVYRSIRQKNIHSYCFASK